MMIEGHHLNTLGCRGLLKIKGMVFDPDTNQLHIIMPKKVSLYSYIHQMNQSVSPSDKFTIAKNIANSMR
jgi:hypothetical protein